MSLIINGIERDTLIFNKNVYKFDHVWPLNMAGANAQNAQYRGKSLGAFTENYATNIQNGVFDSMQVGDTFTQNGHTYKIGGFNYLCGAEQNPNLKNHLLMITDSLGDYAMNSNGTTNGGFAGSDMWKSHFPNFVKQLKTDFGDHLLTWNEFLTTGTDGSAANKGEYFAVQASMMNAVMYWGFPGQYSTSSGNTNYNIGIEAKQLPIMKLHPDEQTNGGLDTWQRDISDSLSFSGAQGDNGNQNEFAANASKANGFDGDVSVRAFFLLD